MACLDLHGSSFDLVLTWQHQITILQAGTWPNTFKTSLLSLRNSEWWRLCLSQPCDGWRAVFGFTMLATHLILLRVLLLLVHPPGLLAELDEDEDHSWKNVHMCYYFSWLSYFCCQCMFNTWTTAVDFAVKPDKIIGCQLKWWSNILFNGISRYSEANFEILLSVRDFALRELHSYTL